MPGRTFSSNSYRYGFNGKEKDNEVKGEGNSIAYELRTYDSRLGRFTSVDPRAKEYSWQTAYAYFKNSPISQIDYMGGGDTEYEVDGNTGEKKKISDLGGDKVDFYHYKGGEHNGQTEIQNNNTCETQWMSSSKYMEGFKIRDDKTDWSTLYNEYKTGTGPEKSLMYQSHPMNIDLIQSPIFIDANWNFFRWAGAARKYSTAPEFDPTTAKSMTSQFIGKANFSFYPIGDLVVVMAFDSKSVTSESFNPIVKNNESYNVPRQAGIMIPESTTHQTYLMILKYDFLKAIFER